MVPLTRRPGGLQAYKITIPAGRRRRTPEPTDARRLRLALRAQRAAADGARRARPGARARGGSRVRHPRAALVRRRGCATRRDPLHLQPRGGTDARPRAVDGELTPPGVVGVRWPTRGMRMWLRGHQTALPSARATFACRGAYRVGRPTAMPTSSMRMSCQGRETASPAPRATFACPGAGELISEGQRLPQPLDRAVQAPLLGDRLEHLGVGRRGGQGQVAVAEVDVAGDGDDRRCDREVVERRP